MQAHRLVALVVAVCGAAAHASDGQLEIHHTCAAGPGCFPGDSAGYPVEITQAGSYRLTSNLTVPAATNGIVVTSRVAIDLGGFEIAGPLACDVSCPAPGTGSGIVAALFGGAQCAVSNGRVTGFALDGIFLGQLARVEGVTISDIARHGLNLGGGSFAAENLITRVGQNGMLFAVLPIGTHIPSLYRDNTISTTGAASVAGGRASGPNVCPDQLCGTSGSKFFYLTPGTRNGAQADAACAPGFHMASLWEIYDPSGLEYDTVRGFTQGDSAEGPPTFASAGVEGWVRTGYVSAGISPQAGLANCFAWTSSNSDVYGSMALPYGLWTGTLIDRVLPWSPIFQPCDSMQHVWCVQD